MDAAGEFMDEDWPVAKGLLPEEPTEAKEETDNLCRLQGGERHRERTHREGQTEEIGEMVNEPNVRMFRPLGVASEESCLHLLLLLKLFVCRRVLRSKRVVLEH